MFGAKDTTTITGKIIPPSNVDISTLSITSLGVTHAVGKDGSFSCEATKNGVTLVTAMINNKNFGFMNIVALPASSKSEPALESIQLTASSEAPTAIEINAETTAVSMVFLTPYFLTNQPEDAARILNVIRNDSQVAAFASIIKEICTDNDPLENSQFDQAYLNATQSVLNTLNAEQSASRPKVSVPSSVQGATSIIELPKISYLKAMMSSIVPAEPRYFDKDYISIKTAQNSKDYLLSVESKTGGSVDWFAEVKQLDPSEFSSKQELIKKTEDKRFVFKQEGFCRARGYLYAPSKSIMSNPIDDLIDKSFELLLYDTTQTLSVSAMDDGIYLIRTYSGGWGKKVDQNEAYFVQNQVPNGAKMDYAAFVENIAMATLQATEVITGRSSAIISLMPSLIVKAKEIIDRDIKNGVEPSCGAVLTAGKNIFIEFIKLIDKQVVTGFIVSVVKKALVVPAFIDVGISGGNVYSRLEQLYNYATPVETAILIVGKPLASYYAIHGRAEFEGNALSGVKITITDNVSFYKDTYTDISGKYVLTDVPSGTHTLTAEKDGYSFNVITAEVKEADLYEQNFHASEKKSSISGNVFWNGSGLEGVVVNLSGVRNQSFTTGADGRYEFANLDKGTYKITAGKASYKIQPEEITVTVDRNDVANQNFTAYRRNFLYGKVLFNGAGMSGVTVNLTGSTTTSAITDENGNYGFSDAENGDYTIEATKEGYAFEPSGIRINVNESDVHVPDIIARSLISLSGTYSLILSTTGSLAPYGSIFELRLQLALPTGVDIQVTPPAYWLANGVLTPLGDAVNAFFYPPPTYKDNALTINIQSTEQFGLGDFAAVSCNLNAVNPKDIRLAFVQAYAGGQHTLPLPGVGINYRLEPR
jgi:hypothetical protein